MDAAALFGLDFVVGDVKGSLLFCFGRQRIFIANSRVLAQWMPNETTDQSRYGI